MKIEFLSKENVKDYISYLSEAIETDVDNMHIDSFSEEDYLKRIEDPFYMNTKSLLAFEDGKIIGRLEYHFYGCFQDGYKMAYVSWVYVLKEYRHKGVAQSLFAAFEEDCRKNNVNQYYLLRAKNDEAQRFYDSFHNSSTGVELVLRKDMK